MKPLAIIILTAAASLGLAACGDSAVDEAPVGEIDSAFDPDNDELAYPVGGELTPEQQTAYDAYDWEAASGEYDRNVDLIREEMAATPATGADVASATNATMAADVAPAQGAAAGETSVGGGQAASAGGATTALRQRSQMTFEWLDRNDDGQLSVAEYAIWALPTNPRIPEPNDARPPYLTSEEINEAGQTFFYFDDDGSTYLSESEFQDARNSARVG